MSLFFLDQHNQALYTTSGILSSESNKVAIVLDHVGITKRHGFVDDIREYDLPKAKQRKGELAPAVETCEVCFAVYRPQPICPVCGHQKQEKERITYEEGELVKMKKELRLDEERSNYRKIYRC